VTVSIKNPSTCGVTDVFVDMNLFLKGTLAAVLSALAFAMAQGSHGNRGCHRTAPALSSGRERTANERSGGVVQEAVRGTEGGAELRPWRGQPLYAEILGQTHAVPAASWGTAGQQHRRANAEDSSSKERAVLQDSEWRPRGRPVHESHLHLPTLRRQPFRLLDRVAETPSRAIPDTLGVDALELPGNTGAKIEFVAWETGCLSHRHLFPLR
jgi:hypothetical protein